MFLALIVMICRLSVQNIWCQCLELKNRFGSFCREESRRERRRVIECQKEKIGYQEKHIPRKRINRFVTCVTLFRSVFGF